MGLLRNMAAGFGIFSGSGSRAFDAARYDTPEMENWYAPLTSGEDENLDARDAVVRRARDLVRNHPIMSGAEDRRVESVVGPNIRLELQPAYRMLGQDVEWADEWADDAEQRFELFCRDPRKLADAEMQCQFGGLVDMAYRHWWRDGEALGVVKMLPANGPRFGASYETCLHVVDPDRLSNPNGLPDHHRLSTGRKLIGGIEYDRNGAPIAGHIRVAHPNQKGPENTFRWQRVPFYNRMGRPILIHAQQKKRAGQKRGISRMVSAMKRIKMLDRYDNAEIEAALLNAVMAATVESPYPTKDVEAAMAPASTPSDDSWSLSKQIEHRSKSKLFLKGLRIMHLLPGEKMNFNRAERPAANYPDFQATGLRTVAASLGLSYAQLAQNWSDINYSSARAMLNEVWRGLLHDRWLFTQAFCTPFLLAWMEEAVARGHVQLPEGPASFYTRRAELTLCEWWGPGRGTVDPLKEGQANDFMLNQGATDLTTIGNEQGRDFRKTLRNQSRERRARRDMGLPDYVPLRAVQGSQAEREEETEDA